MAALGSGCAGPARYFLVPPEPPIVWPPAPDQPRVRYVGELKGSEDVGARKSLGEVMNEMVYGPKPPARLTTPISVAVDPSGTKVAVADVSAKSVHVFDLQAKSYRELTDVGESAGGRTSDTRREATTATRPALATHALESPVAVCWAGETLWVADARHHAMAVFGPGGGPGRWVGRERLKRPAGVAYCPANQLCYVTDAGAHRILAFDTKGAVAAEFGSHGTGPGQFNVPSHIACAGDSLVVSDSLNFRVQRLGFDGSPLNAFGSKGDAAGDLALPKGVAVDAAGMIWVVDGQFENVQAFTPKGELLMALGREGQDPGEFWLPAGVCIDGQNRMWVADMYNRRVQVFALLP